MFSRIHAAFVVAFLGALMTSIAAFAKGEFSFIGISGPGLKDELRLTDPALTTDFFAFANFYEDKTKTPADPGEGYEITRYYVDGKREIAFDRLHYYPGTGLVFYDGIVNGSSEYDGEWYIASPGIKAAFEKVLPGQVKPAAPAVQEAVAAPVQAKSEPSLFQTQSIALIALTAGLAALVMLTLWLRKPSARE